MLKKDDIAPEFYLPNEDGVEISLRDLSDYTVIVYFYPKDNTSGCSIQALDFTNLYDEFKRLNIVVVGISPDSIESHKKFIAQRGLKLILLSDKDKEVAKKYFAYGTKKMYGKEVQGMFRSVFIIKDGKILESFYNVKAKDSIKKVCNFLDLDKDVSSK